MRIILVYSCNGVNLPELSYGSMMTTEKEIDIIAQEIIVF
jgi:hypothetical protein